jgi:hypothetical protein
VKRKGQAVKSYDSQAGAKRNALLAILGQDYADRADLLALCRAALYCPDAAPRTLPRPLVATAWRMLRALKKGDAAFFGALMAVRGGRAFAIASTKGRTEAIDPLRALLAQIAQQQEDGRLDALTLREVESFVHHRNPDVLPQRDASLRLAAREVGVRLAAGRRGRPRK